MSRKWIGRISAGMAAVLLLAGFDARTARVFAKEEPAGGRLEEVSAAAWEEPDAAVPEKPDAGLAEEPASGAGIAEERDAAPAAEPGVVVPEEPDAALADDLVSISAGDSAEASAASETDEDEARQQYTVSYIIGYNGSQRSKVTEAIDASALSIHTDQDGNAVYTISNDADFFASEAVMQLFSGSEDTELGIIGYTVVCKANLADGSVLRDAGGEPLAELNLSIAKEEFETGGCEVPLEYNEVFVYANIGVYLTDSVSDGGVMISTPAPVSFTGLPHRVKDDPAGLKAGAGKSASYDIDLKLVDKKSGSGDGYRLVYGKDYVVSYKNNQNASVSFRGKSESRSYTQLYPDNQAGTKWPQLMINGKGNYAGMKAAVCFDILPVSLADGAGAVGAFADGIGESFVLKKNGGISVSPAPLRYARIYDQTAEEFVTDYAKTLKYRLGKDVTLTLYRLSDEGSLLERVGDLTDAAQRKRCLLLVTKGKYRLAIYGIGNYYGEVYDPFEVYASAADVPAAERKQKLAAGMFKTDWASSGEPYDGKNRDVRVSLSGITADQLVLNGLKETGKDYLVFDGDKLENSRPGAYSITLYGRGKYSGSSFAVKYTRSAAQLTAQLVTAGAAEFNAGGAVPVISIKEADGTVSRIEGGVSEDYRVTCKNNKTTGENTALAMVTVLSSKTGFQKGSSVTVSFSVYPKTVSGADILDYSAFTTDHPGGLYVKTPGYVKAGKKAPESRLYQASADGKRLVEVSKRLYSAQYIPVEGSDPASFRLKLTGNGALNFDSEGVSLNGYAEYRTAARKWSPQAELKLMDTAYLIEDQGNGAVFDSRSITDSLKMERCAVDSRGAVSVTYAGGCYILPVISELTADNQVLSYAEGDFYITYKGNNKTGKAQMTVVLTDKAIRKTGLGGSKTYTFSILRQTGNGLRL